MWIKGGKFLAVCVFVLAGCDTQPEHESTALFLETEVPSEADGIAAHTAAWEGGSRPALDVRKPTPPAGPWVPETFLERLAAKDADKTLLVVASIEGMEAVQWDSPRPDLGILGPAIMTRLDLSVKSVLCGPPDVPATMTTYVRGGKVAGRAEININYPFLLVAGDMRVFLLTKGSGTDSVARGGSSDMLRLGATPGSFVDSDGADVPLSTLTGGCP